MTNFKYEQIRDALEARAEAAFRGEREEALAQTERLLDLWAALGEKSPPFDCFLKFGGMWLIFLYFNVSGDAVYRKLANKIDVDEYAEFFACSNALDQRGLHPDCKHYAEQVATARLGKEVAFNPADELTAEVLRARLSRV